MLPYPPSRVRDFVPQPIKRLLYHLICLFMFSDAQSLQRYLRMVSGMSGLDVVDLRIRQLDGQPIRIRTNGTDAEVLYTTFVQQFHLPPVGFALDESSIIFDLGANIGCTMAHFAQRFPGVTIVGVEMDQANAALARHNTRNDRQCQLVEGAVWVQDGEVQYAYAATNQDGYRASEEVPDASAENIRHAKAYSLQTLCDNYAPDRMIDFVKMDIEGAERRVLSENTDWAQRVRCIKVELHDYDKATCIADLTRLGFRAIPDDHDHNSVLGIRD